MDTRQKAIGGSDVCSTCEAQASVLSDIEDAIREAWCYDGTEHEVDTAVNGALATIAQILLMPIPPTKPATDDVAPNGRGVANETFTHPCERGVHPEGNCNCENDFYRGPTPEPSKESTENG